MIAIFNSRRARSVWAGALMLTGLFFTPPSAQADTYSAHALGSDYYVYFLWSGCANACITYPWQRLTIYTYPGMTLLHTIDNTGAYNGTAYSQAVGPNQWPSYYFNTQYYGWFCDYSGGAQTLGANTAPLRAPGALTATDDTYDTQVLLTWGASATDVPAAQYQYVIYRNNVWQATVGSGTLSWTDPAPVPGTTYTYEVATYASAWGQYSSRQANQGRAFDLNVRTTSLSSGVKIEWNLESSSQMNMQKYVIKRQDGTNAPDFLITIDDAATSTWTDPTTAGGLPWPGYTYTYSVTPRNSDGSITYRVDSAPGSRLPDGSIEGYVKAPFGGGVAGVIVKVERQDTVPQGDSRWTCFDTTDGNGYYKVPGIYYHTAAAFTITPEKPGHGFRPVSENRTLELTAHTVTNLNFTDTSSFTITGRVFQVFAGDTCDMNGVEVEIDSIPRGYSSNDSGRFSLTVDQIGSYRFTPQYPGHGFAPAETTMFIDNNRAGLVFIDTTRYTLSGTISGPCGIYIGTATLRIYSHDGAGIDTTITSDQAGHYSISLPGRDYFIDLTGFIPDDSLMVTAAEVETYFAQSETASLLQRDAAVDFIFRKAPEVQVSGFSRVGCGATYDSVPIMEQAKPETILIKVLERFGGSTCQTDTGYVVVTHDLEGGITRTDTLALDHGQVRYGITPGTPNIIAPHLYLLEMTAYVGSTTDQFIQQVLVVGNRPREQTFVSVSPELPFMILRDPPGDASYSYLAQNSVFQTALRLSVKSDIGLNVWSSAKLGCEYEAGQFIFTTFKAWGEIKSTLDIGASLASSTELTLSITNAQRFATSGNSSITGAAGDVFVGASLNLVYAITDVVEYDTATCGVATKQDLIMGADGFKTTFMYTEDHIRSVLVPQLEEIRDLYAADSLSDSATFYQNQINAWQQTLNLNTDLKNQARFIENRSFSAGVPFESSQEITTGISGTIDFSMYIEQTLAAELGIEVGGSGVSAGVSAKFRLELGASSTTGFSSTRTTGYVLEDDDAGDFFSVDICADEVYATPVFRLVSGRSSCPWEPGTQPREGVQLAADTYNQMVNSPDSAAVFVLTMGNTSQSGEAGTYNLVFLQESNPDGAVLTLGGSQVQGGIPTPYTIPALGSVNATVTVRRGPAAYDYNHLRFVLESGCDGSIADEVALSVHFAGPVSGVDLQLPSDNWVLNSRGNNILPARVAGYDTAGLDRLVIEYSPADAHQWTSLAQYSRTQLSPGTTARDLAFNSVSDGHYDIRAAVHLGTAVRYSAVRTGTVDRKAPAVFGRPEPTDGVLDRGDLIAVNFDEILNCLKAAAATVTITQTDSNRAVAAQLGCAGSRVIILPDTAGIPARTCTWRVVLAGLEDLYGNTIDTMTWVCDVSGPAVVAQDDSGDHDHDGWINVSDNCPLAYNLAQADRDSDGLGDACDPDLDGDTVSNARDNCPYVYNPGQDDLNGNGTGDACETALHPAVPTTLLVDQLLGCSPNPFKNTAVIRYTTAAGCRVTIKVYRFDGREAAVVLRDQPVGAGDHAVSFNAGKLEAGIYFYSLRIQKPDGTYSQEFKKAMR